MRNRILLIDDNQTIHKIVELTMNRQAFELLGARTPEEGLQIAMEQNPAIILIDSTLTDYAPTYMDQLFSASKAGIVLMVSSLDTVSVDYLQQMHAVNYLVKPFNASTLNSALESALQAPHKSPRQEAVAEIIPAADPGPEPNAGAEDIEQEIEDEIMAVAQEDSASDLNNENTAELEEEHSVPLVDELDELMEAFSNTDTEDELTQDEDLLDVLDELMPSQDAHSVDDDDSAGVIIQEESNIDYIEDEMLIDDDKIDYTEEVPQRAEMNRENEQKLLSDLYSLLGEDNDMQEEHENVLEDADDLEDATNVLRKEIEERHELMGMFDDMNQELEDLTTRLEDSPQNHAAQNAPDTAAATFSATAPLASEPVADTNKAADNRTANKFRRISELVTAAYEGNQSITPRAGQLTIDLSKEDLSRIIQRSISQSMLEELVREAVQESLEKIVPALTERIVRDELKLLNGK